MRSSLRAKAGAVRLTVFELRANHGAVGVGQGSHSVRLEILQLADVGAKACPGYGSLSEVALLELPLPDRIVAGVFAGAVEVTAGKFTFIGTAVRVGKLAMPASNSALERADIVATVRPFQLARAVELAALEFAGINRTIRQRDHFRWCRGLAGCKDQHECGQGSAESVLHRRNPVFSL